MKRYKNIFSIFAIATLIMSLSIIASAQRRNNRGNNDNYGNYGNNSYNRNLNSAILNLKVRTKSFENMLDRELDRSRIDGTSREDQLNDLAKRLRKAADDLEDEFNGGRDFNRSRDEAQRVVNYGSQLDRALSNSRLGRNNGLLATWNSIERDIQVISQSYNLNYYDTRNNDRNNRNDRYNQNRNGNQRGTYGGNNGRNIPNMRSTISNLKNNSRRFEDRLDQEDGTRRNRRNNRTSSNLENLSDRFYTAVKKLDDEYDGYRDYDRSYDEVRRVLSIGEQLDREVSRIGSRSIRSDWNRIESDLRTLARAYNLNYNGNNGGRITLRDIFRF